MSNNKDWEPCPRCESKNVKKRGTLFYLLLGFAVAGVSIWLLIIPPIGIGGIAIGGGLMLVSPIMHGRVQCQDCNHSWKPPAEETSSSKEAE